MNEHAWTTPSVAQEIGADAIPILLDIEAKKYEVHPHPGIDIRDWWDMQTDALTGVGELYLDRFVAEVTSRGAETTITVLWAIRNMRGIDPKRVLPILLTGVMATGPHKEISRWAAVSALAEHRDASAVEPLITALQDPDSSVAFTAVRALARYRDKRAVEPLRAYAASRANQVDSAGAVAEALQIADEINSIVT